MAKTIRAVRNNGSFFIMPYTDENDPSLPKNVKKMPAKKRRQWVVIFNNVLSKCIKDGGNQTDCETSAFKQANGVLKEENLMPKFSLKELLSNLFQSRRIKSVDTWSGSASNYDSAEQYCNACLINVNDGSPADWNKGLCSLPVREQGDGADTYVDKAVHAAAGGHGITQVKKPDGVDSAKWDAAVKSAANKLISAYKEMGEVAPDAVYSLAGKTPPTNRSTSMQSVFEQIWNAASEKDPMAFVNDLIVEDDGSIAAIISSNGKLYKSPVTIAGGTPSLGDWIEVKIDYPPVTQSRTTIMRLKDNKVRWLSVSSSAVLNRSGQIDSKKLFDSFVAKIEETGVYPVRRFCHLYSDEFITGQCDFVARDDNLLITSGIYNDTELAKQEIQAREADPEYWGESIGFQADQAQMVELAEGISIPTFEDGILLEISAVPEKYAAAWFTNTTQFTEEVKNMLDIRAKEALVKLFNGDEAAADKWLEDNVDAKNRMIAEEGMITREVADPLEPIQEATSDPLPPVTLVEPPTLELDDAALEAIAAKMIERQAAQVADLNALKTTVSALEARVKALEDIQAKPDTNPPATTQMVTMLEKRIAFLELDEEAKKKVWLEDAPPKPTIRVTHRARTDEPIVEKPVTMADIAAETLEKMGIK
jgi:hypothetical protein